MKAVGMNTAHSTSAVATIGPVTSFIARLAAVDRRQPVRDVALDVFHHDDGVVHHDADGQHQAEQRQRVDAEAQHEHHA